MLNFNTPIIDTKEYSEIKISEIEPILKINLRGKNRDFITKIGKELSIITPVEPNTSSSNEKLNLLWLSPDEWFLYSNDKIDIKATDISHPSIDSGLTIEQISIVSGSYILTSIILLYSVRSKLNPQYL